MLAFPFLRGLSARGLPLIRLCYYSSSHSNERALRNIAIIAHVDHGKTTLVDCLLKQSRLGKTALFQRSPVTLEEENKNERVMDCNDLEKERGITILSKCTSIMWDECRINVVDTPGHADFGGEVERVLSMVDGVLLVVDATEGVMTQTRFVLGKALQKGLKPIVVLNKADRASARPDAVDSEVFDLMIQLEATDRQMNYPILYASAKEGWAVTTPPLPGAEVEGCTMSPLLDAIVETVPSPKNSAEDPFSMLVNNIERPLTIAGGFLGKCYFGKIHSGRLSLGDRVKSLAPDGSFLGEGRVLHLLRREEGLLTKPIETAEAGDIVSVSVSGLEQGATLNGTLCDLSIQKNLPFTPVDPPTLSVRFSANTGPLAGKEGTNLTTQKLKERLDLETEVNPSLLVSPSSDADSAYEVYGRGELQLAILIETMRREGFEILISPPKVLLKKFADLDAKYTSEASEEDKKSEKTLWEPIEQVVIDTPQQYANTVIDKLNKRKGDLVTMFEKKENGGAENTASTRIIFEVPTRGLIGYPSEFKNDTHGSGLLTHSLLRYSPFRGKLDTSRKGAMISMADGVATTYGIRDLEARGIMFIQPGTLVYRGMVIGEANRPEDLEVNPTKTKQLSNVRSAGKDEYFRLQPPKLFSLEEGIAYVAPDEMLEITPKVIRIRKAILDPGLRIKAKKSSIY